MTQFVPRIHESGGACCTDATALCDTCKSHFARSGLRGAERYTPPDSYREGLSALRTAEAGPDTLAGNDARTVAARKTAAAATALKTLAVDYGADQIAAGIIEREHVKEFDRQAAEAAERLGVPVSQLRIASDDDFDAKPPDPYAAGIKALQENRR